MSKYRRKFLSILLTFALIMTLVPTQIFAQNTTELALNMNTVTTNLTTSSGIALNPYVGNGFEVEFNVLNQWEGAFTGEIRITNTGTESIENWCLSFDFIENITNIWNAEITSYQENNYTIKNLGWNQDIAVGESVTFGFNATCIDGVNRPTHYDILSLKKIVSNVDYAVDFKVLNSWEESSIGEIIITNIGNKAIEDWILEFDFDKNIQVFWEADIIEHQGTHYIIKNRGYNANILPGEKLILGFEKEGSSIEDKPNNYVLRQVGQIADKNFKIHIVDEEGKAIPEAIIYLKSLNSGKERMIVADKNGLVDEYLEEESYLIQVQKIGYISSQEMNINITDSNICDRKVVLIKNKIPTIYDDIYIQRKVLLNQEVVDNRISVSLMWDSTKISSVNLYRETEQGELTHVCELLDNGKLGNGDEIKQDNVYSNIVKMSFNNIGNIKYVIRAKDKEGQCYDEIVIIKVVKQINDEELQQVFNTIKGLEEMVNNLFSSDDIVDIYSVIKTYLDESEVISDYELYDNYIEVNYTCGLNSYIQIEEYQDLSVMARGGTGFASEYTKYLQEKYSKYSIDENCTKTLSNNVAVWAPFDSEWGQYDEVDCIRKIVASSDVVSQLDVISDHNATADSLLNMSNYGVIILASHGGNGEWITTGEQVNSINSMNSINKNELVKSEKVIVQHIDINNKKIASYYAITADWIIQHLTTNLPNSIIINNSCESLKTKALCNAFFDKGAASYFGYSDMVTNEYIVLQTANILNELLINNNSVFLSYKATCDQYFNEEGGFLFVEGQGNIKLPANQATVNLGFEKHLVGWEIDGDVRVLNNLGDINPTNGNKMAFISTGTGYTNELGELKQQINIPNEVSTISFDWNYLSEEFLEYIGSSYDDPFCVQIIFEDGEKVSLLNTSVNKIAKEFGATKSSDGNLKYVSPSIVFDQGDVWITGWQNTVIDISEHAGESGEIIFTAQNATDTIFTTAILVDNIKFDDIIDEDNTNEIIKFEESDFNWDIIKGEIVRGGVDPGLTAELAALNLPWAVQGALESFAASLAVPVGNIIDVACGVGLAVIVCWYWDDIKDVWDDIVDIFVKYVGEPVREAFDYLAAKAQGLPTEDEFRDFEEHYEKHGHEFADMPGGNGKKPDKKDYWKRAKKFMKETGKNIKEGVSKTNKTVRIKFNTKTLEYIIYNPVTGQVMTYFLPGWDLWRDNPMWAMKALTYFLERIE